VNSKRILVVAAHPDDAEFTSGGSLVHWAAEGWALHLIVCTDGRRGSHDPAVDPRELAVVRRAEQLAAAAALGIADTVFLDHVDGELATVSNLVAELTWHIRRVRPDRLLGWDPWARYQLHPDHRTAGLVTLDAVLAAGNPHYFSEQLTDTLQPHHVKEVYLFGTDQPDEWVDITATFKQKMAAIALHHSQIDNLRSLAEGMSHCNQNVDAEHGYTYAEAYKVLHPFCDT